MKHLFFALALCALAVSCSDSKSDGHVILWNDGVALYSVIYTFDGVEIGRGKAAYNKLIESLDKLPDGSRLKFTFPADVAGVLLDRTQLEEPLPFDRREQERTAFNALLLRKQFVLSFEAYIPKEYLR
jgi:hypothetical protein